MRDEVKAAEKLFKALTAGPFCRGCPSVSKFDTFVRVVVPIQGMLVLVPHVAAIKLVPAFVELAEKSPAVRALFANRESGEALFLNRAWLLFGDRETCLRAWAVVQVIGHWVDFLALPPEPPTPPAAEASDPSAIAGIIVLAEAEAREVLRDLAAA